MITKVNGYCVKMFTMENFGEWLLNAMKEAGISSQSELARRAGLSKGTISNLVNGTKGVGIDSLSAIARVLRLPPDLVYEKANVFPANTDLSPVKRAAIHAIETADDEDVDFINRWLNDRQEHKSAKLTLQPRAQK